MRFLFFASFILLATTVSAQNPLKISNKIIVINSNPGSIYGSGLSTTSGSLCKTHGYHTAAISGKDLFSKAHGVFQGDLQGATETVTASYNNEGYKLTSFTTQERNNQQYQVYLIFEKSDSYKEQELRKLVNELTTRIDTVSKRYVDSAMAAINLNVLNYLHQIPRDVISKEYADMIKQLIVADMDNRLKALKEEIIRDLRQSTATH